MSEEEVADYTTPRGEFSAILKMPTRHMRAPEVERNTSAWFDLPGVPWSTFFTYEGIAIHGTYWHNDYGLPRSHGCVNVPISAPSGFTSGPIPWRRTRMTSCRAM